MKYVCEDSHDVDAMITAVENYLDGIKQSKFKSEPYRSDKGWHVTFEKKG